MLRGLAMGLVVIMTLASPWVAGCGGEESGPQIFVDVNVRNLYNKSVAGISVESRCSVSGDCPTTAPLCWDSQDPNLTQKFCRECELDVDCTSGSCDHGFCHETCTQSSDCGTGEYCTAGFCRKAAYTADISFTNNGGKELEIYTDQLELHGQADACAYPLSRMQWDSTETTIRLASEDSALLRVTFTPPDVGAFRAALLVYSNDTEHSPLDMYMCGQAVEQICDPDVDTECVLIPCGEEEFRNLAADPEQACADMQ